MALFFDFSIPFLERDSGGGGGGGASSENKARKDARLRAVVRAMELGYAGVAYDRPFRGVLSDADRCKIAPFPLSSLLKAAPALAASAAFHRDLLGAPLASPFRQYTRLTISAHCAASAVALNGNALLRTYDLVALRPLNQDAFDKACESSEVDIIAMDFSQKLPFRLKLPFIKLAIQRGLYFEITYSHLIADVHVRRQILSDAKLLADWTRGKNLIFSSAASTVNDVRGPYDVANLAVFLLGLSLERAKAAISGNCRSLVANALRKKHFYKETIRIERILPDEQSNSKRFWFDDWNEWDPLSSGKGDLPSLDNMPEMFSSTSKPPFSSNSIDFTSIFSESPFLFGENPALTSSIKTFGSPTAPNEIPAAVADDATDQVAIDESSLLNKISMTPTTLSQQKPACEDVLVSPDDMATVLADSKESCQSFELSECLKISDECMVSHTGTFPSATAASKASNYTYTDDLLLSNADQTSSAVTEKKPSNMLVEVQKSSDQFYNLAIETSNDAAEFVECIPDVAGDQMSVDDEGHFFADVVAKKDIPKIVEQEQKRHGDHCMTLQKCLLQPVSSNIGASLISSGEDILSKGALKETKEQKEGVPFFKIDALVEKNTTVVKDEIQKSETKSGRGNHRERLSYPAYPLPFKSLFKPLLFQKKLCKPKRKRKHL
ncbi:protein GAMETOPHYTE DEFECTIVE 1 [Musa acuminata AAA Group]|uniref:protein GAMETOPHYTE DEFECTIVE 1 n=1 Tax=Musa acuminata AAA Group TaxID=214697 RepID=UPI0031E1A6F9